MTHAIYRVTSSHLFAIGQSVRLKAFGKPFSPADTYRITGMLPPRENSPQYRIRNDDERHERVITQDSLEPFHLSPTGDGEKLNERTFDMAKGQQRSNREIRKPKQEKAPPKPESTFANQIKLATNASRGKSKS
jgi:hypothetical protein